jgi:ribosomal protein S18 acetylase RimI-like enzyme
LAIAPRYQQQELDERLLVHIMELAGKEKLNLALTANVGRSLDPASRTTISSLTALLDRR